MEKGANSDLLSHQETRIHIFPKKDKRNNLSPILPIGPDFDLAIAYESRDEIIIFYFAVWCIRNAKTLTKHISTTAFGAKSFCNETKTGTGITINGCHRK